MGAIKAVIFDLDGVLADAGRWHYPALSRALAEYGFSLTREEHSRRYDGLTTAGKLQLLSSEKGLPAVLHTAVNELKQRYTLELIMSSCRPREAHIEMLSRLRAEGYKLAVASNSLRRTVEAVLDKSGLLGQLDLCLSGQDVLKPKPDPAIYLAAFAGLRVEPGECLALEDHPSGLEAARRAGARAVKVAGIDEVGYTFVRSHIEEQERNEAL